MDDDEQDRRSGFGERIKKPSRITEDQSHDGNGHVMGKYPRVERAGLPKEILKNGANTVPGANPFPCRDGRSASGGVFGAACSVNPPYGVAVIR